MILLGRKNVDNTEKEEKAAQIQINFSRLAELMGETYKSGNLPNDNLIEAMHSVTWFWRGIMTDWKETHD